MQLLSANPFWPSLIAISLLIASMGVGSLDAQKVGLGWQRHAFFFYFVPSVILAGFGVIFAMNRYDPEGLEHCRDALCRMTLTQQANHMLWLQYGLAELAGLALIGIISWYRGQIPFTLKRAHSPLEERFPLNRFFRVPSHFRSKIYDGRYRHTPYPQFDEDLSLWNGIIDLYPTPPKTDNDREAMASIFWDRYAASFSGVSADGTSALRPKQKIIDYFEYWEKWIFREYFAATGEIHKSIVDEHYRLWKDFDDLRTKGEDIKKEENYKGKEEKLSQFEHHTCPQHFEKWGHWFYLNIQAAFKNKHEPNAGHGPSSPITPVSAGHSGTGWNPNA